jgi:hypothetical protein
VKEKIQKTMNRIRILLTLVVLTAASPLFAESSRTDYRLDHEFFRRGLIDRGFDDWLKVYDRQHPPASDIDLLAEQIGRAWLNYRRETDSQKRDQNLGDLLQLELERVESYPDHPLAANWRVRYAGDLLNEKIGPQAFVHLVNLTLPENLRPPLQHGLDQIETQLTQAEKFLQSRQAEFQKLNDAELAQVNRQGLPELYQSAIFQANYLQVWCLYHRAELLPAVDPNRVKILYKLSDLLQSFEAGQSDSGAGSVQLLRASVDRSLGKLAQARSAIERAINTLPGTYLAFAHIERARLALAENEPQNAVKAVEKARSLNLYPNDSARRELLSLSLLLLEGRAKLAALPPQEKVRYADRNKLWSQLTAILTEKPNFRSFVFPQLVLLAEGCPQSGLADIELLAYAENAMTLKKVPLAQSALRELIARKSVLPALKTTAAMRIASSLEQEGKITQAVEILAEAGNISEPSADLLTETARLAWLAYRSDRSPFRRDAFIQSATRLLNRFPQSDAADQFRLLMAEEFSQEGQFNQAQQWIAQVPAGSPRYLQAQAQRVLVLTRQYKIQTAAEVRRQATPAERILADQVETACSQLLIIASAKQKEPEKFTTWQLDDDQLKLISGAILASADVLSDPALDQGDRARTLLAKYRPLLDRYQQTSKSALAVQITTLAQTASPAARLEAVNLTLKLLEENALPLDQLAGTVIYVLETVHQADLDSSADLSAQADDLARANFNLARKARDQLVSDKTLPASLAERLSTLYAVAALQAGNISEAKQTLDGLKPSEKSTAADLTLARAKLHFAEKNYLSAATTSMQILQEISPQNIRYWHALIVNLRAHQALNSDRDQIAAAILARKQEYPDLGNAATRIELEKILHTLQPQTSKGL